MTAEPLQRVINSIQFSDQEISRICSNASKEANKIMGKVGSLKSAQVQLAALNVAMWKDVKDANLVAIGDAVWGATEYATLIDEGLFDAAGLSSTYWKQAALLQAKQGLINLESRKINGISLSDKVYKSQALAKGLVDSRINTALALGLGPKDIAKSITDLIRPDVRGGVSYAAMRLGRSEVNNAFHRTSLEQFKASPWVEKVKWNLSGSHRKPDECNQYAEVVTKKGWGHGEWDPAQVPGKPHPNCLCYITAITESVDQFAKKFKQGKYDDYVNGVMGCTSVA